MGFLLDEDDGSVLEAALSFVDDYAVANEPPIVPDNSTGLLKPGLVSYVIPSLMERSTTAPFKSIKFRQINAKVAGFQDGALVSRRSRLKSTRQKKSNSNRVRDEAQFELVYLRDKVKELETKLRSLQLDASEENEVVLSSPFIRTPRVWEDIATRQKRRCDLVQHENARLKVLVERKQKMTTSLCEVLQKRLRQLNNECVRVTSGGAPEHRSIQVLDFQDDIGDFQDLLQRIEAAYQEQEAVFAANGLSNFHDSVDAIHVREDKNNQVEVFASKILPFSLHDTGAAAWDHFKGIDKHLDNGGLYGKSIKNLEQPFTILEDFTKELFSKKLRADVQVKQIVRRCVEPGRDMILFVSSMTPTEIKHKAINGLIFHAQEYALTKCVPDPTCGRELSLLQLCTRISIECQPGISIDARYIRSAARFWIDNVADNIKC